ncbi:proline-rich receptor-like protein kinase PERK15 [Rutidosis leptorrhynchoides]|uniref:proline-rich receptor-like protein kinase PERK15 n=1 Tax=Rutidosis leptorrhynchoides TaxID=125765 RepID=UPI003A992AC9
MIISGTNRPVIEFPSRLRIALGAAKGLAYLHEDCKFIHISYSNVKDSYMPWLRILGLPKLLLMLIPMFQPERWELLGKYNFLVEFHIVVAARPLLIHAVDDGNFDTIADSRLHKKYNHNEMARIVSCAATCVRHSACRRPRMIQAFLSDCCSHQSFVTWAVFCLTIF